MQMDQEYDDEGADDVFDPANDPVNLVEAAEFIGVILKLCWTSRQPTKKATIW